MKSVLLIALILFTCKVFSQERDTLKNDHTNDRNFETGWISLNAVLALECGFSRYQTDKLNHEVEQSYGSTFSNQIAAIGASYSGSGMVNRRFAIDLRFDYMHYYSLPIIMELNDSSRYYMSGFHFGMDGGKDLFPQKENIDLLVTVGFNTGRLVYGNWDLTVDNKTNRTNRYRNPFFAPNLGLEQRFIVFKHLSISIRSELQWDVSNKGWNMRNTDQPLINNAAATGYSVRATLGWRYQSPHT